MMYIHEFTIVFVVAVVMFSPLIWIWFSVHMIQQWMQRVDQWEKEQSNQKDGK